MYGFRAWFPIAENNGKDLHGCHQADKIEPGKNGC